MSLSMTDAMPLAHAARTMPQPRRSEATRYLAAAAHSDATFRKAVLEQVVHTPFRCRAPEFGIDEEAVIRQCRIADRRWKLRDLLLFAILLIVLVSGRFWSNLAYTMNNPEMFGLFLSYYANELVLVLLAAGAVVFGYLLANEHFTLRHRFTPQARHPWNGGDAQTVPARQNMVVYGAYLPFVGSGLRLRDWSFSVNLQKSASGEGRPDGDGLTTGELEEGVARRIGELAIPGLEHYKVLFADGRYVRADARMMPSPYNLPPRCIPEELLDAETGEHEDNFRRSYLCLAVTDWSGELVLTTYLRFKKGKSHLFAEVSHFILPPLKQAYYQIDSMDPRLKLRRIVQLAVLSLVQAPFRLVLSPFFVWGMLMQPLHHWSLDRTTRKAIRDNPMFNYGARSSIRELGMENRFRVYFQQLDRDMHLKTIEQCMIDAIIECLEAHDIDTSDIRERRNTILNSGVIISGGVVNADSLAVGKGASSVVSKVRSAGGGGS